MKNKILVLFFISLNLTGFAQSYFQQEVNYAIQVKLNDVEHTLSAYEEIEYINNSPFELNFIYFHLWPNGYSNSETALAGQLGMNRRFLLDQEEHRGYIDSLDFKVNGNRVRMEYDSVFIDVCKIFLNEPLQSGSSIKISTPFKVKIPKGGLSRLGHMDQAYQISQWFPKPAVFDRYGWHAFPYLDMGEFYSEFGSFDVKITLPANYIVGATGDLQNEDEIEFLNQLAEKNLNTKEFEKKETPVSDSNYKTLHYKQSNIHDFAWFADKDFLVLKGNVALPQSGRNVETWVMFNASNANVWKKSIEYINDAVYYYSKFYGEYPYNQATAVFGGLGAGGGMEYPNVTVIGGSNNDLSLEMVIMHEVGHNWWYGILGSNEREFPWIDEGINSYSESRYMEEKYGVQYPFYKMIADNEIVGKLLHLEEFSYTDMNNLEYQFVSRFKSDQAANLHSIDYKDINYGMIVYKKVALVWNYLWKYLGDEEMDRIMHKFFNEWKFRHPHPTDIRQFFEQETGQNLAWLFDDLLGTTKVVDYKITKLKNNQLELKNIGQINSPVGVFAFKHDSVIYSKWINGFAGKQVVDLPELNADYYQIGYNSSMMDNNFQNNSIKTKGLLKKVEPIKIRFAGIVENNNYTNLNYFPTMGYNLYNGYMLGAVFYNDILPHPTSIEYHLMPMYAFGNQTLSGSGDIVWHYLPDKGLDRFEITLSGNRYAFSGYQSDNFYSLRAQSDFYFSEIRRSGYMHKIGLKYTRASDINEIIENQNLVAANYYELNHFYKKNQFGSLLKVEANEAYVKSTFEAKYGFNYWRNKSIKFRVFGGLFLYQTSDLNSNYRFNLSGTYGGDDYTYSNMYPGRFENPSQNGFASSFMINDQGGFISYSPYIQKNNKLFAINTEFNVPFIPNIFKIYGSAARVNFAVPSDFPPYQDTFFSYEYFYEIGAKASLVNGFFEIYFPLIANNTLQNYAESYSPKWKERIRFSLNLNIANPFKLVKTADLGF